VQLPAKPYYLLSPDERLSHLEDICRELYAAHLELGQVRVQYLWSYGAAYKAAQSQHVTGRIQEAEIAAGALREDELELIGRIDALGTMRDYLVGLGD
jgi:hypothetical protein